jgi:hypothetical protein
MRMVLTFHGSQAPRNRRIFSCQRKENPSLRSGRLSLVHDDDVPGECHPEPF